MFDGGLTKVYTVLYPVRVGESRVIPCDNRRVDGFDKGLTLSMYCIVPIEIREAEGVRQGPD